MPIQIRDVIARRTDLGTFLVHLTRGRSEEEACENLKSILASDHIEARQPFGQALSGLGKAGLSADSQRCVCFTETPLEHVHLLAGEISGRSVQLSQFGVAIPKKLGRRIGVNPVWYLDISVGHNWLTVPFNQLIDAAIASGAFEDSPVAKISPFVEQMGTHPEPKSFRKEFWWEREWRHCGDLQLPRRLIVLCPEHTFAEIAAFIEDQKLGLQPSFIDPVWGVEQIIARLAGFPPEDVEIL